KAKKKKRGTAFESLSVIKLSTTPRKPVFSFFKTSVVFKTMSDGGITVLDGTQLRSLHVSLPTAAAPLTGARLLDLAESSASQSLLGLSLPQTLKSSALSRLHLNDDDNAAVTFRQTELDPEAALKTLNDYIAAIADELHDNPMVVSILDGSGLRDEDDFAMIAESLFTDLDTEDKGKISKTQMKNALHHMGVEMGVPPVEDFPLLNDILKKHGVEGEAELGQSQFAELLLPILQDVADALAENHVVVIHKVKIVNGSVLRKLLANENRLNDVIGKMLQEKRSRNNNQESAQIVRDFLQTNGKELGLPPPEANEAVNLLYDAVFADSRGALEKDEEYREFTKEILEKFAEQLDLNPVYCDLDN
ncbi:hypothetical protein Tsubulata_007081, partial [Turnera subulata]